MPKTSKYITDSQEYVYSLDGEYPAIGCHFPTGVMFLKGTLFLHFERKDLEGLELFTKKVREFYYGQQDNPTEDTQDEKAEQVCPSFWRPE